MYLLPSIFEQHRKKNKKIVDEFKPAASLKSPCCAPFTRQARSIMECGLTAQNLSPVLSALESSVSCRPIVLYKSFDSLIGSPSILEHISFQVPAGPSRNLVYFVILLVPQTVRYRHGSLIVTFHYLLFQGLAYFALKSRFVCRMNNANF